MRDRLDEFINKNKDAFDDKEVSDQLWNKIETNLKPEPQKARFGWVWKVAAVFFIGATLVLLLDKYQNNNESINSQYIGYNQELIDVESYYSKQISIKRIELENRLSDEQKDDFLNELDDLDQMYLQLKSDLKSNKNNDKLISAMIQNLQLRVEILSKQINILERISKVEKDEKISI